MMGNGVTCSVATWQDWAVVAINGDFTIKYLVDIRTLLDNLLKTNSRIAFDLSETLYVDSSAITLISNFSHRMSMKNGKFAMFGSSDDIFQIFSITGLDKSVTIYKNRLEFESKSV